VYYTLKMTMLWLALVAVLGLQIFRGGTGWIGWIPGNRYPNTRQGMVIRSSFILLAILMIWQGWRFAMSVSADVFLVVAGSTLMVVLMYIPDLAHYLSRNLNRLLGKRGL
jgi:hypothetical protein